MNQSSDIKLSLLENSHAFLNEAVTYALSAKGDVRKWQFALLNLVQSLELSLKSLLRDIHPILVYENIDAPKHTVGPLQALDRLNHPKIANANFSETERRRIRSAIDLRNQMTHSEFTLKSEYAVAKFFEIFGFITLFQARHFKCEIENIITDERLQDLLAIQCAMKELAERAAQRISEEGIDKQLVICCPNCEYDTFVIQDDINTCYTCRNTEVVCGCPKCGNSVFNWQMRDFSNEFDTDGTYIHNDYGYDYFEACFECIGDIREDIAKKRADDADDEYYWEMERYYWEQEHGGHAP